MTADRATRSAIRMGETNRCRWSHDHFEAWNDTSVRLVFRSLPLHRPQASWHTLPLPDKRSLPGKELLGRPVDVHIRMQTTHRKTIFPVAPHLVPIPRLFCLSAESPRGKCRTFNREFRRAARAMTGVCLKLVPVGRAGGIGEPIVDRLARAGRSSPLGQTG
jgi:hypothetical protein